MDFITGSDRDQMTISSLDSRIDQSNPVRFVDAFVDCVELVQLGFEVSTLKTEGRPAFESKVFL